jgi:DNA repair exonuclease SbcCD ATPase subunit
MVHKLTDTMKFQVDKMPANHKAGIHRLDTVDGASSWLEEMDTELAQRDREIEQFNKQIEDYYAEKEAEDLAEEKQAELDEAKSLAEEEREKLQEEREEIFNLRKDLMEKELEKTKMEIEEKEEFPSRRPRIPFLESEQVEIPSQVTPEIYMQRPVKKPVMEELEEAVPKIKETLAGASKFITQTIPSILFPKEAVVGKVAGKAIKKVAKKIAEED